MKEIKAYEHRFEVVEGYGWSYDRVIIMNNVTYAHMTDYGMAASEFVELFMIGLGATYKGDNVWLYEDELYKVTKYYNYPNDDNKIGIFEPSLGTKVVQITLDGQAVDWLTVNVVGTDTTSVIYNTLVKHGRKCFFDDTILMEGYFKRYRNRSLLKHAIKKALKLNNIKANDREIYNTFVKHGMKCNCKIDFTNYPLF